MALELTHTKHGHDFTSVYAQVGTIRLDKTRDVCVISVLYYLNNTKAEIIDSESFIKAWTDDDTTSVYVYLKTLSEFANATDV